jgi:hypothetical protein
LGTEICFEHERRAMRREGPEKFHGRGADTARRRRERRASR